MLLQAWLSAIVQSILGAERLPRISIGMAARALGSVVVILASGATALGAQAKHLMKQEVVIWKSQEAQNQAAGLIAGGALQSNPDAVRRLVACVVPNGTELIVIASSTLTSDVRVASGKFAGCTGNVKKDFIVE